MKIQSIRGVKDILPGEIEKWHKVEAAARRVFSPYGFKEIRLPIFESTHLFKRSIGETTDIVEKEMYTFTDRGGEEITLRPEGTASVVRSYVQHKMHGQNQLVKLYYMGPMFRYERPQAGRFRQFYQIGAEAMGSASPTVDAEVMTMLITLFNELGLNNVELQINSLGCPECRPPYRELLKDAIRKHLDELCSNCTQRYERNPLRVLDCKVDRDREIALGLPRISDHLCQACRDNFAAVQAALAGMNTPFTVNNQLVRGLDYYTRTTFEVVGKEGLGSQNAICGGGRYDSLVEEFEGPPTPCFGFAVGVERLIATLPESTWQDIVRRPDIFAVLLGDAAQQQGHTVIQKLRAQGWYVELDYEGASMKSQMRKANREESRFALIIGDNEIQTQQFVLKNMGNGEQVTLDAGQCVEQIRKHLDVPKPE
ncbi:histidine--tRNA ligase [Nitrospina watsonii]|uniref:Histidine--tRNA ligase n=1 Tax=Nitrospina watsonii TaxID=1323948 RepID=A0ABM9HDV9_9BACT|nr:histidine--tRNA ligase [Nitrospina watsonii]CAI2718248.1 Histidine--tRNA ligase [Nitrospina watsonii]